MTVLREVLAVVRAVLEVRLSEGRRSGRIDGWLRDRNAGANVIEWTGVD
jgi:hypothetical protein